MQAYVFPGQGAQFVGMGKELYEQSEQGKSLFKKANDILGFNITEVMFAGTDEELKQTKVTQPAIFLHSVILAKTMGKAFKPDMVAGHSLGEFSALVANEALSFEDGLKLVAQRAQAMQKACDKNPSTMAAILGSEPQVIEEICQDIDETVVPANYNSPSQIVISGTHAGIDEAIEKLKEAGAKRAIKLKVGGAFHSPLMEPAEEELSEAIQSTDFNMPICPVYQNVTAQPSIKPKEIKQNLVKQLTSPVKWLQSIENMIEDGGDRFIEVGPGKALQKMIKKINRKTKTGSASSTN